MLRKAAMLREINIYLSSPHFLIEHVEGQREREKLMKENQFSKIEAKN